MIPNQLIGLFDLEILPMTDSPAERSAAPREAAPDIDENSASGLPVAEHAPSRPESEAEFVQAMQAYKQASGRMFPTWSEVLEVLRGLGYRKAD